MFGIGFGSIIAAVLSYSRNSSFIWALLHALLGWIYVVWFAISYLFNAESTVKRW